MNTERLRELVAPSNTELSRAYAQGALDALAMVETLEGLPDKEQRKKDLADSMRNILKVTNIVRPPREPRRPYCSCSTQDDEDPEHAPDCQLRGTVL